MLQLFAKVFEHIHMATSYIWVLCLLLVLLQLPLLLLLVLPELLLLLMVLLQLLLLLLVSCLPVLPAHPGILEPDLHYPKRQLQLLGRKVGYF